MTTHLTEKEAKLLDNIARNEYAGAPGEHVWTDCLDCGPHGLFVPATSFGGLVASLVKKGLAGTDGTVVWLTEEGLGVWDVIVYEDGILDLTHIEEA